MDVLTHTLSGLVAGTAVSSFSVKERGIAGSVPVMVAGMLGGFMPDFDAISLWSGFDQLFGKLHGLNVPGRDIYFGKWTFSHHGALHSLLAGILWAVFIFLIAGTLRYIFMKKRRPGAALTAALPVAIALFMGYCMHLLGDIPTPGYVWGGIRLWWPASFFSGGLDRIWWWNNYDIFIVVLCSVSLNLVLVAAARLASQRFIRFMPAAVLLLMIVLSAVMVGNRQYRYNYTSFKKQFADMERKSLDEQKRILGSRLYNIMTGIDKQFPFNF